MQKTTILIRYNTENKTDLYWRVLIGGVNAEEMTARNVYINVRSFTSENKLPDGRTKHHITCFANSYEWRNGELIID